MSCKVVNVVLALLAAKKKRKRVPSIFRWLLLFVPLKDQP